MALNITQTLWLAILSFNCKEKLFFKAMTSETRKCSDREKRQSVSEWQQAFGD